MPDVDDLPVWYQWTQLAIWYALAAFLVWGLS